VKIMCWNLGHAAGRWRDDPDLHDRAWHWIAAVDPDLAFLQETQPPEWARERWEILTLPHSFWASALVTKRGSQVIPVVLPPRGVIERAGSFHATAEVELPDGDRLFVASVHASPHEAPPWGCRPFRRSAIARASVGKPWWNDVAFAGFRDLVVGRRFLIAGDWNTSRWLDKNGAPEPAGAEFFDRAAGAGWVELSLDADGREGKTWYGSTNPRFCQLDHVFADSETAATVRSFRIDPHPVEAFGLSDHAPMILELDLEVATTNSGSTSAANGAGSKVEVVDAG
jgi:endonuclease/exonuclease/phosphatase family metal-dependent hydrolase